MAIIACHLIVMLFLVITVEIVALTIGQRFEMSWNMGLIATERFVLAYPCLVALRHFSIARGRQRSFEATPHAIVV